MDDPLNLDAIGKWVEFAHCLFDHPNNICTVGIFVVDSDGHRTNPRTTCNNSNTFKCKSDASSRRANHLCVTNWWFVGILENLNVWLVK